MRPTCVSILALLALVTGSAARADTAIGRITYISPDGHQLILDSNDVYSVAPHADPLSATVADRVKITFENHGVQRVINALSLAPLVPGSVQ
jgi:hypothetical protein